MRLARGGKDEKARRGPRTRLISSLGLRHALLEIKLMDCMSEARQGADGWIEEEITCSTLKVNNEQSKA